MVPKPNWMSVSEKASTGAQKHGSTRNDDAFGIIATEDNLAKAVDVHNDQAAHQPTNAGFECTGDVSQQSPQPIWHASSPLGQVSGGITGSVTDSSGLTDGVAPVFSPPAYTPQAYIITQDSYPRNQGYRTILNPSTQSPSLGSSGPSPNLSETYGTPRPLAHGDIIGEAQEWPLDNVEDAILMRHFVETIAPWFDICDNLRHFQTLVPQRARRSRVLYHAVLAVAARHISRLSKKSTDRVFYGQVLHHVKPSTAVEYMLECIPYLTEFPEIADKEKQEDVTAAAIILRQYEEIAEELPEESDHTVIHAITNTVISSPNLSSLATATYWISVRQEVYYALIEGRVPQSNYEHNVYKDVSPANAMIFFAGEVARWRWGEGSFVEWERLRAVQEEMRRDVLALIQPAFERVPDRSKGEVLPTIWYLSDADVTGAQHFELARMLLIAENPILANTIENRAAQRKVEAEVRQIVLRICGMALGRAQCAPATINGAIAMLLYGDYFTDAHEKEALMSVLRRLETWQAWPISKYVKALQGE
ncbi:DNA replication licensing factor mcm6 [Elsinoe australis]|uniref:DNA replication licensing factor mcm6 n=1 Tax=Elsinoe australis TaxID=40998 RepID=A0A2P7YC15_9PEZI|nr:DNA replication licensing factor mcm6 [Elsinoe australis]